MTSESQKTFREWLEEGRSLAAELASKKSLKKRRATVSKVTWRNRDKDGKVVPKRIRRNRSVKHAGHRELSDVESTDVESTNEVLMTLDEAPEAEEVVTPAKKKKKRRAEAMEPEAVEEAVVEEAVAEEPPGPLVEKKKNNKNKEPN